ncbi:hypothetical protein [Methylobacterium sp. 37f]|uniref:hypothetical protein n=1 Tax=Methylobacterium sp. 37f TaxID=2817058 RepID=UPI001FFC45C2|nr:hypothetical protein [Methylobacterium sp. 37f]MCK2057194.1 hypothetical protein [Methylobacterium sp. 37f]
MTTRIIRPTQTSVGLPAERLTQLRALADRRGVSAVEVVEHAIRQAIEAGEIDDTLPGFAEVAVVDDDLLFVSIRDASLPLLDGDQARLIAAVIDAATGSAPLLGLEFKSNSGTGVPLGRDHWVYIGRHVKAVTFAIKDGETGEITLRTATTASIATDFARLLRKHAAQIMRPIVNAVTVELAPAGEARS